MKKKIFLLIFPVFIGAFNGVAQVNVQDSLALVALYDSLDGSNWTNNTNWNSPDSSVSTWANVYLTGNRVTSLYLGSNNLSGTIPSQFFDLNALKYLYLSHNNLTGNISSRFDTMQSLLQLGLDHNTFSGNIPQELGNMTNLQVLYLNHNLLTDTLPESIGNMTALQKLFVNNNNLSGSVPATLSGLSGLNTLGINNNLFTAFPNELGQINTLSYLYLNNNQFSGLVPDSLYNLTNLVELWLNDNNFGGSISPEIGKLTKLVTLGCHNNAFSGILPDEVGQLSLLEELYLTGNTFTEISDSINNLKKLKYLYADDNALTDLPIMDSLYGLLDLSVRLNQLTFDDLEAIQTLGMDTLIYWPQDSVRTEEQVSLNIGNPFSISSWVGGSSNSYQWYFNDSLLSGETDSLLSIGGVTLDNAGDYKCHISSTLLPKLTLKRRPVHLTVVNNVGVTDDDGTAIQVYPNPGNNVINLTGMSKGDYFRVYDAHGRQVLEEEIETTNHNIPVIGLPAGSYFYRFTSNRGVVKKTGVLRIN